MKEKFKVNPASVISIVKASLVGLVISILMVLLFAFVLKFVDLNSSTITTVDQIIKVISIFIAVFLLSKSTSDKVLIKGIIVGALYSVIAFVVFSILNGGVVFSVAILTDVGFSSLVGGVSAILLNIAAKK